MDSITKSTPVFNAKTGVISYTWNNLTQEKPPCPHCREPMEYWYSRKRGVIISDHKYTFMSPCFKCGCGRTMTMRPYFIAERKQYRIFSIQEIINADTSGDSTVSAAYGSSMVDGFWKWSVALVKGLAPDAAAPLFSLKNKRIHVSCDHKGGIYMGLQNLERNKEQVLREFLEERSAWDNELPSLCNWFAMVAAVLRIVCISFM